MFRGVCMSPFISCLDVLTEGVDGELIEELMSSEGKIAVCGLCLFCCISFPLTLYQTTNF